MPKGKEEIFISHADADKEIASELIRLLASGLNITGDRVFCSSLPGRRIPGGFDFVKHIKSALESSEVVLLLLTENYFISKFCLAELGACWISKENYIPIIVPPLSYDKLKATLSIKQSWKINDSDGLDSVLDDMKSVLSLEFKEAQWGFEKKAFLEKIEELIKKQEKPSIISADDFEKCKNELLYCKEKLNQCQTELDEKKQIINELEKTKDREAVRQIKMSKLSEYDQFETICSEAKKLINEQPSIVGEALYYFMKNDNLPFPDDLDKNKWDQINEAVDSRLLFINENEPIEVNIEHTRLKGTYQKLLELKKFMESNKESLESLIEEEYEVTFHLADRDFWWKLLR